MFWKYVFLSIFFLFNEPSPREQCSCTVHDRNSLWPCWYRIAAKFSQQETEKSSYSQPHFLFERMSVSVWKELTPREKTVFRCVGFFLQRTRVSTSFFESTLEESTLPALSCVVGACREHSKDVFTPNSSLLWTQTNRKIKYLKLPPQTTVVT